VNHYYITGTSKGIGKALAELLLEKGETVTGISRSCSIEHHNYTHHSIDLSDLEAVKNFEFQEAVNAEKIALVNNAGTLGEVSYVGNSSDDDIINAFNINLTAVAVLTNKFIKAYITYTAEKIILNITSGAAHHIYDGWSAYCTTKAGMDMFTRVIDKEQQLTKSNIKIMAVAPGIIETQMQEQIRNADESCFSAKHDFIEYHQQGMLKPVSQSARQLFDVLKNPSKYPDAVFDLRDLA